MICFSIISLLSIGLVTANSCPCGWKVKDGSEVYTHRIFNDFSTLPDNENLLAQKHTNKASDIVLHDWIIYDFWQNSDNPNIRLNAKYDAQNVKVHAGTLQLQQNAYGDLNLAKFDPVHIAGIQTRAIDILHGTFRAEMKLEGYDGGSCASFFWYHDDRSELDIEAVTPGTSLVNDTINYTSHPSLNLDGSKIPNATHSIPLQKVFDEYRIHRIDCDVGKGVRYYLDNKLMHTDTHNVPQAGGSLQLKLWADGNKWWSGMPSRSDTFLKIKSIIAYFNTTSSLADQKWHERCAQEKRQCEATFDVTQRMQDKPGVCRRSPCPGVADKVHSSSTRDSTKSTADPSRSNASLLSLSLRYQLLVTWIGTILFKITR